MIDTLADWHMIRSNGLSLSAAEAPLGHNSVRLVDGIVTCSASKVGMWPNANVMRSEVIGFPLRRFGPHNFRFEFLVPKFWWQDACIWALTCTNDAGEAKQGPLSLILTGDRLKLARRFDPAGTVSGPYHELANVQIAAGAWHSFDLFANLSWLEDGLIHASFDGKRMARFSGPTTYDDQTPPAPCFGTYSWDAAGEPMEMRVREATPVPIAAANR